MLDVKVTHFDDDLKRIGRELAHTQKQIPKATAMALTWMGQAAKKDLTERIPRVFDRPTRWTQKSIYLRAASARNLSAKVWIKPGSISSLAHHVEGSHRPQKRFEKRLRQAGLLKFSDRYAVPGVGARLNQYGNISRGQINKILSAMGAQGDKYANTTTRSLKRNSGQGNFFFMQRQGKHPAGVYKRTGSKSDPKLRSIIVFFRKAKYQRRFHFYEWGEDAAYDAMDDSIDRAINRILR